MSGEQAPKQMQWLRMQDKQIESLDGRSRREIVKIRNYPFMNGLRLIRRLFKKNREKISQREGLIGV